MKKKFTLLFAVLLSLVGVTQVMAQKALPYSYGFEDYNLDTDGWTKQNPSGKNNSKFAIVGEAKKTGSYGFRFSSYDTNGENTQYLISPELNAPNGVIVSFAYKVKNGSYPESFKVGYSTTDTDVASFTWDEGTTSNSTSFTTYENTFPAGTKYVAIYYYSNYCYYLYVDDFSFTAPANGPALTVTDYDTKQTLTSPANYNFGLATPGTTHYFLLNNPGTEDLGVSVSETGNFGATLSTTTVPAGGASNVALTVTMPDATGNSTITITPASGSGIDPFVINVSGTIRDASKLYEYGFTSLPEDWTTTGSWYHSEANGAYTTSWYLSSNSRLITPLLTVGEGESFFVEAKGYSTSNTSYQHLQMQYSADGSTWTNFGDEPTLDPSNWNTFAFTGAPAGKYYIAINASQADVRMFYGGVVPQVAKMVVTQPASLDFGVITAETTKTFTIANTGKATLEGISVESTNSSIFTISGAPASLAAGESAEVTITMAATTTGALSSNITVSATDMEDVKFTVTGVVLPDGLTKEEFTDGLPTGWTNASWTFDNGEATGKSSSAYLTTPKLIVSDGDLLVIKAKRSDSDTSDRIDVQVSTDGSSFTTLKSFSGSTGLTYPDYATLVVSDIPTTTKYIRFVGYYVVVDEIAGLTYSADAPVFGYYTDSECTAAATATIKKDFGFVSEAPTAQVYYIKNDGTGTMSIALGDVPAGFTAALGKASLAAGESTTLTINMPADTKGYHGGNIVVTATNSSNEQIGTFTVTATGVMMEEGKLNLDFATTDVVPSTWIATDWNKNDNGYYRGGYSSTTMETSTLTAAAGEEIVIVAKQEYSSGSFSVNYKKVDAEEWSTLIASTSLGNSNWITLHAPIAEAGDYKFQIVGNYYAQIQRIYGLTAVAVPFMETTATNIAFGMQTAESAEQSFTISNTGEAVLTGLSLTLGKTGDEAQYSFRMTDSENATFTGTELAVGQTITVYVKQLFDSNYGSKSDVLTIAADGQDTKTINLSGTTRDASLLYVDFDDPNAFPEGWQTSNWSIYTFGSSNKYAYQSSGNSASALVTTPLTVETDQKLSFNVSRYQSNNGTTSLKTRYSKDGGATWSAYTAQYGSDSNNEAGSAWTLIEIAQGEEGLPTGNILVEFFGSNIKLDMIQGVKTVTAPALALTEDEAAVENGSTKDFGNLSTDGVVTYTLKNIGNDVLKSTITGDGVTVSPASVELAAGETAEITVTMAFAAPYGEKAGKMTIESEGWVGDVVVNYTAETVDPTNFVVDFEDKSKPAGWYSENWTYTNGYAYITNGTAKPMITELVGAEEGKNVLSFDAKIGYDYGTSTEFTLSVYTSTDRKNWTEAKTVTLTSDVQKVTLDALADGNYYVKFEAANAQVDNIKGLKKLDAPVRDLYVSASTLPTGTPFVDTEIAVSATVASLLSTETGVYAKLFVDDAEVATADAADIAVNGTKTFSMSYTAPAEAGKHTAYIEVYYSDDVVAFTTLPSTFNVISYPTLTFDETSSEALNFTDDTYDITLKRSFVAGWNTICLPFEVKVTDIHADAVAYSFGGHNSETGELTFNKVTALEAAKPYIIYIPVAITEPIEFKRQLLDDWYITAQSTYVNGGYALQGTYAPMAAGTMTGYYGVANYDESGEKVARIAKAGEGASMKGFRAFIRPANQSEAKEDVTGGFIKALVFMDGETAIRTISADSREAQGIFDLSGRKLNQVRKGVNIVNGKKVLVK